MRYIVYFFFWGFVFFSCQAPTEPSVVYNHVKYIKQDGKKRVEFFYDDQQRLKEWKTYFDDESSIFSSFRIFRNDSGRVIRTEAWTCHFSSSSDLPIPGAPLKLETFHVYTIPKKGMQKIENWSTQSPSGKPSWEIQTYDTDGTIKKIDGYNVEGILVTSITFETTLIQQKSILYDVKTAKFSEYLREFDTNINPFYMPEANLAMIPIQPVNWQNPSNLLTIYSIDANGNKVANPLENYQIEYNSQKYPIKLRYFYNNTAYIYEYVYE